MDHFDFWHWVSSGSLGHIKLGDSMPRVLESLGPPDYWDFNIHNYPNMINYDDFYIYFDGNSYNDAVSIFCVYEPSYKTIDRKDFFGVITRRKHKSKQTSYNRNDIICGMSLESFIGEARLRHSEAGVYIWKDDTIFVRLTPYLHVIFSGIRTDAAQLRSVEWTLDNDDNIIKDSVEIYPTI